MHPILFKIPLPHTPLKLWWALVAVAGISIIYALLALRRGSRADAISGAIFAAAAGFGAYNWRATTYQAENIPIYSYGMMLAISLVVGWYITLPLAARDKLPAETMANCYVITALAALAGSRILYVATNPAQFETLADWLALRRGGLVAYGGFVGGFLGSFIYLRLQGLRLMPWADIAVPSLASGLFVTRIGCYLYGCDFGTRLSVTAPGWLKKLGSFPKLPDGTMGYDDKGNSVLGSPAFAHHLKQCQDGMYKAADCVALKDHSLPVHPTQLYEALIGLGLFAFLLYMRKKQKFRGQIFFLFAFGYGFLRFLLELIRDDTERGNVPPQLDRYVLVGGGLLLFAAAFTYGPSLSIADLRVRMAARVASFAPGVAAIFMLKPGAYQSDPYNFSTSQFIGLLSAITVAYFYAGKWEEARKHPKAAMSLGIPEAKKKEEAEEEDEEEKEPDEAEEPADDEEQEEKPAPPPQKVAKKGGKKKGLKPKPKPKDEEEDDD